MTAIRVHAVIIEVNLPHFPVPISTFHTRTAFVTGQQLSVKEVAMLGRFGTIIFMLVVFLEQILHLVELISANDWFPDRLVLCVLLLIGQGVRWNDLIYFTPLSNANISPIGQDFPHSTVPEFLGRA